MPTLTPALDDDLSLATRAAWLHYGGRLSQAEVAKRLGITKIKAHRLIGRANQEGVVKVTFDGKIAQCAQLEFQISKKFDLSICEVAPDLGEADLPLRSLGIAGAAFLQREIASNINRTIGFGNGRTLASCVTQLPRMSSAGSRFVSLMGGLTRNFAANPHDVMHRLAEKTGAEAYFMPVPFFANNVEDREVILSQRGVPEVMTMAADTDSKIVGIGTAGMDAQTVSAGVIDRETMNDVSRAGGVGELVGHFFDEDGNSIETALTDRTLSVGLEALRGSRVVAVAGGHTKLRAINSILRSGLLAGLITDERTANALIA